MEIKEGTLKLTKRAITYLLLIILCLLFFFPFFIILTTSLKTLPETTITNFKLLPNSPQFINYANSLRTGNWARYFFNSFYVTTITVIGSLILNSSAGYSLSRLKFKGSNFVLMFFLVGMMVPPQSYIIPQFIILKSVPFAGGNNALGQGGVGWLNTYMGLIIPFLNGSFGILLCRQFYITFPKALDDAARIDGCSPFKSYFLIYLPLSKPILATLLILKSVHTWNNFFYPLIMTTTDDMLTVQLALQKFRGQYSIEWTELMAATLVTILPIVVVFITAQKYFVRGIVTSGVKG